MESSESLDNFSWEGKMEPSSPAPQDWCTEEVALGNYDFCNDNLFINDCYKLWVTSTSDLTNCEDLPLVITVPPPEKIEDDQWHVSKLKSSQGLSCGSFPQIEVFDSCAPRAIPKTEELLKEFVTVCENYFQLTPPQTPPQEGQFVGGGGSLEQQLSSENYCIITSQNNLQQPMVLPVAAAQQVEIFDYQVSANGSFTQLGLNNSSVVAQHQQQPLVEPFQQVSSEYPLTDSFGFQPIDDDNIARNLELVEAVVRARSKDLPNCNDEDSCSFSEAGSTATSEFGSSYCGSAYSRDLDDEWSPTGGDKKKASKISGGGVTKKRTRPYGRGIEDKKSRKKEQNKNAATRYRQKKKAEIEEILIVEKQLLEEHRELNSTLDDKNREKRLFRKLLREIFHAQGAL